MQYRPDGETVFNSEYFDTRTVSNANEERKVNTEGWSDPHTAVKQLKRKRKMRTVRGIFNRALAIIANVFDCNSWFGSHLYQVGNNGETIIPNQVIKFASYRTHYLRFFPSP